MASVQSISAALEAIDEKKENLRKTFESLQSQTSLLSSFTLQWKDLDEHFDSVKKSIKERFDELASKEKTSTNELKSLAKESLLPATQPKKSSDLSDLAPRPEIMSFCISMNGMGLRSYIMSQREEQALVRREVGIGLKLASDPAKLVLDAMAGFFPPNSKGNKDQTLAATRRTCILLLELLTDISPQINPQVKENATKLANEWKGKIGDIEEENLGQMGFLQLVAAYGLTSLFDTNYLIDLTISIARRKQTIEICRSLRFGDKLPDLVQKLIDKGKHLNAINFAYAFELVDKFPPVPLLQDYRIQAKKSFNEVISKGNPSLQSQNEATSKLISALKGIVKCSEEHKLEAEFPPGGVITHIQQLEKEFSSRKRPASTNQQQRHQPKGRQQSKGPQQSGNNQPRGPAPTRTPSSTAKTGVAPITPSQADYYHLPHTQGEAYHLPSLLLPPDRVSAYLGGGPSTNHGSLLPENAHNSTVPPQYLSNAGLAEGYGSGPISLSRRYDLSPPPSRSQLYSFEHHLSSSATYDRLLAQDPGNHGFPPAPHQPSSGGYGLPPSNHPSYYP